MQLMDSVRELSGVGEKIEKILEKVGIYTLRDLLYYLPRGYRDFSAPVRIADAQLGEPTLFCVDIYTDPKTRRIRKGMEITSFQVSDGSAIVNVDIFNQVHIKSYIKREDTVYMYGKLTYAANRIAMTSPEIYFKKPEDPFAPIYPLTAGLKQNMLRKFIKQALKSIRLPELYSEGFLRRFELPGINEAICGTHFPRDMEQARECRSRMVFDELLVFCRMIELLNEERREESGAVVPRDEVLLTGFTAKLGFSPTGAQQRVMREIAADLGGEVYMNRLIQGDVGSGKTALAFFAMHCVAEAGFQSVMMAPTEILAEQHVKTALSLFPEEWIVSVTGAMGAKARREAKRRIEQGEARIIIGTHALIYGDMAYANLGLIITDEQHRFGVKQRAAISGRRDAHSLIMSATPIPRSLALVLYGRTDISIVDELPPGRKSVKTYIIRKNKYGEMLEFIRREILAGRQAYIVCPLIEESENDELKSAKEMFAEIGAHYPGVEMELLHGRLKAAQKQDIMQRFAEGQVRVLVSTTVIEVGINVPNATVMAVLNAERFGLAQLHQLRGRVGRGAEQSYCFLVSDNRNAWERLRVMAATNDGFEIAEKDMQYRGTGDIFGTRQHGAGTLMLYDLRQLDKARETLRVMSEDDEYAKEYARITAAAVELTERKMLEIALN